MYRIALLFAFALTACVLEEATDEDIAEVSEIESESATSGPTITELANYQQVTISGAPNTIRYFKLEVPAGRDHVVASRLNTSYNIGADIYMKRGALPTSTSYECRGANGTRGTCKIDYPTAGTYYIMVLGVGTYGYTNMPLTAYSSTTYQPIGNNTSLSIWNQYGIDYFYKLSVPAGTGSVSFTFTLDPEDDGAFELVVKRGLFATETVYDCKRLIAWEQWTSTGTCTFTNPPAGTYYVGLLGNHWKVVGTFSARYRWPIVTGPTENYLD